MLSKESFSKHHQVAASQPLPAAESLTTLLPYVEQVSLKMAIDLGCGAGTDTLHLLRQGWQVLAVDQSQEALNKLRQAWPGEQLTTSLQTFEEMWLPPAHLINASFALPFCKPEKFDHCWSSIVDALQNGGAFSGHFFGLKDSWANRADMTFLDEAKLKAHFTGFTIKWFKETERDGKTLGGMQKHWHVYHVAAVKL